MPCHGSDSEDGDRSLPLASLTAILSLERGQHPPESSSQEQRDIEEGLTQLVRHRAQHPSNLNTQEREGLVIISDIASLG